MRHGDVRSRRIAVVSDAAVNAHLSGDVAGMGLMAALAGAGCGIIQLPPEDLPATVMAPGIRFAADQVQDYLKNGYAVADALYTDDTGVAARLFRAECRRRGLTLTAFTSS